jgi:pilus assembly protein Flp/PilA
MLRIVYRFRKDETGATMVEYGLLVGLIALVVALGATVLGQDISTMFNNIGTYLAAIPLPA